MADRILRLPVVLERTGLSRTTLWRRHRSGDFPAPVQLGGGIVGWLEGEVDQWIAERPRVAGRPVHTPTRP